VSASLCDAEDEEGAAGEGAAEAGDGDVAGAGDAAGAGAAVGEATGSGDGDAVGAAQSGSPPSSSEAASPRVRTDLRRGEAKSGEVVSDVRDARMAHLFVNGR